MTNALDVLHIFDHEQDCKKMVESWRWPNGDAECPACQQISTRDRVSANNKYYLCDICGYAFTAWIDTPLKGSNLPIDVWLAVIALVVIDSHTISDEMIAMYVDIGKTTVTQMRPRIEKLFDKNPEIIEGVVGVCESEWQRQHGKPKAAVS